MATHGTNKKDFTPKIVGSFGSPTDLKLPVPPQFSSICDLVEIRLDRLALTQPHPNPKSWSHWKLSPLLFTARIQNEGGALNLNAKDRIALLEIALPDAAYIDIEVASITEMSHFIQELNQAKLPWIASFHDFVRLPTYEELWRALNLAAEAGACVFKVAAMLQTPTDLANLAEFQLTTHSLPVATMGMGKLAPVSRLLCAQAGSVLNYGYLGHTPTAPGQWPCELLSRTLKTLPDLISNTP